MHNNIMAADLISIHVDVVKQRMNRIAIERLLQVTTNVSEWFNFLSTTQTKWSRFVTVVKQSKEIDTISYHTRLTFLKQYQNKVNDILAERIPKCKSIKLLRHKGKEIAKPVTPQFESVSEEDSDPEQAQRDKDMQKNWHLPCKVNQNLQTYPKQPSKLLSSNPPGNKTEDTTPRYNNDNQSGQFGNQRTMTVAGTREP
ncbi:hypothetical protein Tco_1212328 [Tanacetum coccineum]